MIESIRPLSSRNSAKFRFGIGAGHYRLSSIWSIVADKCDLYVGVRIMMGSLKLSIHGAEDYRRCHIALTKDYWKTAAQRSSPRMDNRDFAVWDMPSIPDKGATEVVSIWFPRNYHLKEAKQVGSSPEKSIVLFPVAPPDAAVRIRLFEGRELPSTLLPTIKNLGTPLGKFELDDGRNFVLVFSIEDFDSKHLEPILRGQGRGTIFDQDKVPKSGETVRDLAAVMWTEPQDGKAIHLAEVHGFNLRRNC